MDDFAALDATAQAELVRRKEVKPIELVEAAIGRIERVNPELNAVITPMYDLARKAASGPLPDGPFTGVPFLLKDLLASYAGVRMTWGSAFLKDYVPDHDSELVARLQASRTGHSRQDEHAGVRHPADDGAALLRADAQPLEHGAQLRRLQRRLRCGRRFGHGPDRARQRRRRLDTHPRFLLRPLRPEADARPQSRSARTSATPWAVSSSTTPSRAPCATAPALLDADLRPRHRRPVLGAAAGASVRPGSRRRPRKAAHRLHDAGRDRRHRPSRLHRGGEGRGEALRGPRSSRGGGSSRTIAGEMITRAIHGRLVGRRLRRTWTAMALLMGRGAAPERSWSR